jgi:translation initiation factor 1
MDWKDALGAMLPEDFKPEPEPEDKSPLKGLPHKKQDLRVMRDKKRRAGKTVTLVTGFDASDDEIEALAKILKTKCGVGGTAKDGEVMVQGDFRDKILGILKEMGYKAKPAGG